MAPDDVAEELLDVLGLVDRVQHRVHGRWTDRLSGLDELDQLVQDGAGLRHVDVVALDRHAVSAEADRAVEAVAQGFDDAVADPAELGGDVVGDVQDLLHPPQFRRVPTRPRRASP